MKKSIIHIQMNKMPFPYSYNGKYNFPSDQFSNGRKCLNEVLPFLLSAAFSHQASFITTLVAIRLVFDFVYLLATYRMLPFSQ